MARKITNHLRTNKEKMEHHRKRLEYWQGIIDEAEDEALRIALVRLKSEPARKDKLEQNPYYIAKTILVDNYQYNRAIGNRNGHEHAVNVYRGLYLAEVADR